MHENIFTLIARTVLTQTFRNTEAVPIEALYCFPLEEGSTMCAMRVRTGGRTLVAIAEEKEKAFKSYDDAMAAGQMRLPLGHGAGGHPGDVGRAATLNNATRSPSRIAHKKPTNTSGSLGEGARSRPAMGGSCFVWRSS